MASADLSGLGLLTPCIRTTRCVRSGITSAPQAPPIPSPARVRSEHHQCYHVRYLSEPILGRFVTLQKVVDDGNDLGWAEVRVESTPAWAELEQEENVRVFMDSAIM